jgi:hypothetical protein
MPDVQSIASRPGAAGARRYLVPLLALASLAAVAAEPSALEHWQQLGKALWRFDTDAAEAGPDAAGSYLVSPDSHRDFVLTVDFWVAAATNSGVFVRCGEIVEADDVNPFDCYEINIYDEHPLQENRTGAIVQRVAASGRVDTIGQWNRLEIRAQGATIAVSVNGVRTATLTDARTDGGRIALQYGGTGLVRFRRLSIETA